MVEEKVVFTREEEASKEEGAVIREVVAVASTHCSLGVEVITREEEVSAVAASERPDIF